MAMDFDGVNVRPGFNRALKDWVRIGDTYA
jgi:hypothetical protein